MLDLCAPLGLIVNILKSNLTLSQEFHFGGIYFQTVSYICCPSTEVTIDALASHQGFEVSLSLCRAADQAPMHIAVDRLSDAFWLTASDTETAQFCDRWNWRK